MSRIGEIKIFPFKGDGAVKGAGSVVLFDELSVNIRICQGSNGLFVGWPTRKGKDKENPGKDKYFDEVFFINKEFKAEVSDAVVKAYEAKVGGGSSDPKPVPENPTSVPF